LAGTCHEGQEAPALLRNWYLQVRSLEVELGEDSPSMEAVEDVLSTWHWLVVWLYSLVELPEVDDQPQALSSVLLNNVGWRGPGGVGGADAAMF
jgi:hypothetical protein